VLPRSATQSAPRVSNIQRVGVPELAVLHADESPGLDRIARGLNFAAMRDVTPRFVPTAMAWLVVMPGLWRVAT